MLLYVNIDTYLCRRQNIRAEENFSETSVLLSMDTSLQIFHTREQNY